MQEFPKMAYGPNASTAIVSSPAEMTALGSGWSDKPSDPHRAQPPENAPMRLSGHTDLALTLAATVVELMNERFDLPPKHPKVVEELAPAVAAQMKADTGRPDASTVANTSKDPSSAPFPPKKP